MRACVVVHPCVCVHAKERAGEEDTKWKYVSVCNRKEIVSLNSLERGMGKAAGVSAQSKNGRARGREREFESVCEGERERVNITRTRDPKTKQVPKREEAVGRRKSVT